MAEDDLDMRCPFCNREFRTPNRGRMALCAHCHKVCDKHERAPEMKTLIEHNAFMRSIVRSQAAQEICAGVICPQCRAPMVYYHPRSVTVEAGFKFSYIKHAQCTKCDFVGEKEILKEQYRHLEIEGSQNV